MLVLKSLLRALLTAGALHQVIQCEAWLSSAAAAAKPMSSRAVATTEARRTALAAAAAGPGKKNPSHSRSARSSVPVSRDVALAIVPPDQVWDTLQRARYYARDKSYEKWPPCLRLLHPFAASASRSHQDDLALKVAAVIEKYKIEPFEIHLTEWSVIPHAEAMEADWRAMQLGSETDDTEREMYISPEDKETQDLIAREERKGRENLKKRTRKQRNQQKWKPPAPKASTSEANDNNKQTADSDSPKALWEKQMQMYEEFNGPCVVCLEPDEESRNRIMELRELLLADPELAPFASYGPTLTMSDMFPFSTTTHSLEYRPIIPIASFPTVTSAVEMARKLRMLWDPLTIQVQDLQVISTGETTPSTVATSAKYDEDDEEIMMGAGASVSWMTHATCSQWEDQMGCDAMVMLAGEEVAMDNDLNEEMANMIANKGQSGGYGSGRRLDEEANEANDYNQGTIPDDDALNLDRKNGDTSNIFQYLNGEDDDDEEEKDDDGGTVVVIGRTHFFTGEMRDYVGMPATSATDGKDRPLGSSGAMPARRRGAISRSSERYGDRERDDDDLWRKRSKVGKQNRLID